MNTHSSSRRPRPRPAGSWESRSLWLLVAIGAFLILLALRSTQTREATADQNPHAAPAHRGERPTPGLATVASHARTRGSGAVAAPSAEEIVAQKVTKFARSRRELARAIARRHQKELLPEVEKFFDAIEAGHWEEIERQWLVLSKRSGQYEGSTHSPELDPYWNTILDSYGAAEQAHLWPAQKLLDYGNGILDSLRPGMVYVGGTDNGRWIPALMNDTNEGERHVVITQNAFADSRYVEYMNELYGDQLSTLTREDSDRAFKDYLDDARKRLDHDQQFPDEPKQVRPGEDVRVVDGKVQVGGQIAVMSINERLLQALMAKNPDLSFAIQESYPFKGTYADALPLGPLMELGARGEQNTFTTERATQSLEYWQEKARQVFADPEAVGSDEALKSYSHDAVTAANLLAAHQHADAAEETYRLAAELWPENPESIAGLAELYTRAGRENEAQAAMAEFSQRFPKQRDGLEKLRASWQASSSRKP